MVLRFDLQHPYNSTCLKEQPCHKGNRELVHGPCWAVPEKGEVTAMAPVRIGLGEAEELEAVPGSQDA